MIVSTRIVAPHGYCRQQALAFHGFLKFVLYQKFTAENAGFAEFFKFFSAFFALSAVKALFVSTLRKPWHLHCRIEKRLGWSIVRGKSLPWSTMPQHLTER